MAREQAILRKNFDEGVVKDLECYKIARSKVVSQYLTLCQNAISEVDSAYSKLDAAKALRSVVKNSLDEASEKLEGMDKLARELASMTEQQRREREREQNKDVLGRMFGLTLTPEQEREKALKKVNKLKCELLAATEDITSKRRELIRKIEIRDDTIDKVKILNRIKMNYFLKLISHLIIFSSLLGGCGIPSI